MSEGRGRFEWAQTSLLAMLIAEPNRDSDKHSTPYTADYFNPYSPLCGKDDTSDVPEADDKTMDAIEGTLNL